jgi:hypothetical protein
VCVCVCAFPILFMMLDRENDTFRLRAVLGIRWAGGYPTGTFKLVVYVCVFDGVECWTFSMCWGLVWEFSGVLWSSLGIFSNRAFFVVQGSSLVICWWSVVKLQILFVFWGRVWDFFCVLWLSLVFFGVLGSSLVLCS